MNETVESPSSPSPQIRPKPPLWQRLLPWLIGGGRHLEQPLDVEDVATAARLASSPDRAQDRTLELAGPSTLSHRQMILRAAHLLGQQIRISSIPKGLVKTALAIRQRMAPAGFSPDVLEVITADTKLDPNPAAAELGIELTGLDEMKDFRKAIPLEGDADGGPSQ